MYFIQISASTQSIHMFHKGMGREANFITIKITVDTVYSVLETNHLTPSNSQIPPYFLL